jgi:hypothetical protein
MFSFRPGFNAWLLPVLTVFCLLVVSACGMMVSDQLTEHFTSQDGSFTVSFPSGWTVLTVGGQISLGSRVDILMPRPRSQVVLGLGDVEGSVYIEDAEDLGLAEGESPTEVLQRFRLSLEREQYAPTVEPVETLNLGGRPAARVQTRYDSEDQVSIVIELDDGYYGVVSLRTGRGGGSRVKELAAAIAASIVRNSPQEQNEATRRESAGS